MKRIFISGALNSFNTEMNFIDNVHRMLRLGHEVRKAGFAVYVPCNDILVSFTNGGLPHEEYYKHDLVWLDVCDAVILVPGWECSRGVKGELEFAKEKGLPVFESIDDLVEHDWVEV